MEILKLNKISKVAEPILKGYDLVDASENPTGILVRSFKMDEYTVPSSLLAVARAGAGVNNIPHADYAKKGICVFNTPGANSNAVKELVIAYMLIGCRNISEAITWSNSLEGDDIAKQVEKGKAQFAGSEIIGKTLCVLGLGAIGRKIAIAVNALGMNVVGYDPYISEAAKKEIPFVTIYDKMEDSIKEADFITLHMPATAETTNMINSNSIKLMKDGIIIINAARAELVDVEAVKAAIADKKVKKYVCDFPDTNTVRSEGIICAPHIGASTEEAEDNCAEMAAKELKEYIENGNVINSVNMPNVKSDDKLNHRLTIISNDNGENKFGGISAAKNGIRYTIIDSNDEIDVAKYTDSSIIKARLVY